MPNAVSATAWWLSCQSRSWCLLREQENRECILTISAGFFPRTHGKRGKCQPYLAWVQQEVVAGHRLQHEKNEKDWKGMECIWKRGPTPLNRFTRALSSLPLQPSFPWLKEHFPKLHLFAFSSLCLSLLMCSCQPSLIQLI